jgi:translocation and assembly module TamB
MARLRRATVGLLAAMGAVVLVVVVVLLWLTRTDPGVERAGQYVVERLRGSIEGELEVAGIRSRGLLRGVTLAGLRITGPDGRLFLEADSARLSYRVRTLLGGDISFDRLTLYRPAIHLERLPGRDEWNFEIIFPADPDRPPDEPPDNIVLIQDATIHDGFVAVRIPYDPAARPGPPDERLVLEDVPGGTVRTLRFQDLNGRLPRILWQAPDLDGRMVEIRQLSGLAYLWDTPADVRDLRGTVSIRDSIVTFRMPRVRLPDSELSALGQVVVGHDDFHYNLEATSDSVAFRDFQWLYPRLPAQGGGALSFRMQTRERGSVLWLVENARLATPGTRVAGSFGVVTGDTLYFANVDLRASPLDLELVQRLLPLELPVEGLLIGTVEVDGPISALRTRGDLIYRSFADGAPAESEAVWSGVVQVGAPWAVQGLDADIGALDLAQLAAVVPALRLRGLASGRVHLDGSLVQGLTLAGRVALDHGAARSAVRGQGRVRVGNGRSRVDLEVDAETVALSLLADQYPALTRLAGEATGPVRLAGTLEDLRVNAHLATSAGDLQVDGRLDLAGAAPGVLAEGRVAEFRLDRILSGLPETLVTGDFELAGALGSLATVDGRFALNVSGGRMAGVEVQGGRLRGTVADGLLRVDSMTVATSAGRAAAAGTVGLVAGRSGSLDVAVVGETLASLEPILFTEPVPDEAALEGPRVAGSFTAAATLTGSVHAWDARGTVRGQDLIYEGLALGAVEAELGWGEDGFDLHATGDSLRVGQRLLPEFRASVQYVDGGGRAVARVRGVGPHELELGVTLRVVEGAVAAQLDELELATGEGHWALAGPVTARLGRDGVAVDDLVLTRAPGDGRVRIGGVLPWRLPDEVGSRDATMAMDLDDIPIGEVLGMVQSGVPLDGVLTASIRLGGTALTPVLDGTVAAIPFRYGDAVLDSVGGVVAYRDRLLTGRLEGRANGRTIVGADAAVPIDLALTDAEDRLLDRPIDVRVHAQGMPAGLVSFLMPGLEGVDGVVDGSVALIGLGSGLAGTGVRPRLEGGVTLTGGTARVDGLNVAFRDIFATANMDGGSVVDVHARLSGEQGSATVRGSVDLARPSDPAFDLHVSARRFEASRRRDVTALADAEVHLGGRYSRPIVGGDVFLVTGELNLDEVLRQHQIVQLDASLFQLFDAATLSYRPRPTSPFLENLVLSSLIITAERNVWLRSRELNVEVAGSLDVDFDRQLSDIRLTGSMQALRGMYQLQVLERLPARRFEIRDGSVEFAGTPGIDPNLNITATHRVRRAQGDPLDVVAHVTGTVRNPRIRLSSESDPPVSESDLASFLLFGRSTLELSQAEADVVANMREGMLGLARPVFLGLASTQLQQAAANLGLPVDHLALTAPEYGFGDYSQVMSVHGGLGVLQGTQLEAGFYAHRDIFVLGSFTPFARATGAFTEAEPLFHPRWGARVEWRFRPTWTAEMYWEDRFARTPSFTYDQVHDRPAGGLSVFREWGY